MHVFARTRYKPLIDVDPMVQVAAIRIYYNLKVYPYTFSNEQHDSFIDPHKKLSIRPPDVTHGFTGDPHIVFILR